MDAVKFKTFYEVPRAAELLDVSVRTIRRYVTEGALEASKMGRKHMIKGTSIKAYIERRKDATRHIEAQGATESDKPESEGSFRSEVKYTGVILGTGDQAIRISNSE